MRPIYAYPENFRESLATPTATFLEIVNGLLLRSIVCKLTGMCVQNLKFVVPVHMLDRKTGNINVKKTYQFKTKKLSYRRETARQLCMST